MSGTSVCGCTPVYKGFGLICKLSNRDARTKIKSISQGLVLLSRGNWFCLMFSTSRREWWWVVGKGGWEGVGEYKSWVTEKERERELSFKDRRLSKREFGRLKSEQLMKIGKSTIWDQLMAVKKRSSRTEGEVKRKEQKAFLPLIPIWVLIVFYAKASQSLIILQTPETKLAEWTTKGMKCGESGIV